eukprot:2523397-Prymnesium_polylepis.1
MPLSGSICSTAGGRSGSERPRPVSMSGRIGRPQDTGRHTLAVGVVSGGAGSAGERCSGCGVQRAPGGAINHRCATWRSARPGRRPPRSACRGHPYPCTTSPRGRAGPPRCRAGRPCRSPCRP